MKYKPGDRIRIKAGLDGFSDYPKGFYTVESFNSDKPYPIFASHKTTGRSRWLFLESEVEPVKTPMFIFKRKEIE